MNFSDFIIIKIYLYDNKFLIIVASQIKIKKIKSKINALLRDY